MHAWGTAGGDPALRGRLDTDARREVGEGAGAVPYARLTADHASPVAMIRDSPGARPSVVQGPIA